MKTNKKGMPDGLSGVAGTVIASSWRGIPYIKSKPDIIHPSKSPKLKANRGKFREAFKFVKAMKELVAITFNNPDAKMTAFNSAVSHTLKNAVLGEPPAVSIDYARALVSRGELPNADNPSAATGADGTIVFSWMNNAGIGRAKAEDKVILVAYSRKLDYCEFTIGDALRGAGSAVLDMDEYGGYRVQTYIAFISENGLEISNSIYTGEITLV
jgi:hypothetical protein